MSILLLIIGLILFIGLVVVHELGHFWAARRNGVEVEEFGIGFPPRAWSRKTKAGYDFSLNWLPIGGFVKLKGESDAAKEKGSLGAATTWAKTKIMLAGVFVNLLVGIGLLTVLAWVGMPQLLPNQFTVDSDTKVLRSEVYSGYVEPGSPAAKAGLESGDRIDAFTVDGKKYAIDDADDLSPFTEKHAGQKVTMTYERDDRTKTVAVTLRDAKTVEASRKTDKPKGYLGVTPGEYKMTRSTWSAPVVALGLTKQIVVETFRGLGNAIGAVFQGNGSKAAEQVSGPVGIVFVLKESSLLGYQYVLLIIAIISLTLAIMNVLPIPALDGGRLYMILLTRLFGKELSQEMEERIVGASFIFLLFLIVLITIVDVRRFF
ncbi:MAG TPA: M50 family metallopeptidase [Candidatus Saccharimonadales bacterium]|nr:M50 family metallopeptidase [Candidatus Saccharimonadales bacterium]